MGKNNYYSSTDSNSFQQGFRGGKSYEAVRNLSGCGFSTSNFSPLLPQTVRPTNCYKGLKPLADHNVDSERNCGVNRA
jgi:hypothetical protein